MESTITFGVTKTAHGRYAIFCNDSVVTGLSYARKEFAAKKAEEFARRCYKPFVNFQGVQVSFKFVNLGERENNNYNVQ